MNAIVRIIAVTAVSFFFAGCITPAHSAEKPAVAKVTKGKAAQKKATADIRPTDGTACVPWDEAKKPNPTGGSVQPRLRRGYEPWREIRPEEKKQTVTFTDSADPAKRVELPVTKTQYCDPQKRVWVTVSGFPGYFTRGSEFEYCRCSNPASVRLDGDQKYDRRWHVVCNGELMCPPRPPKAK